MKNLYSFLMVVFLLIINNLTATEKDFCGKTILVVLSPSMSVGERNNINKIKWR